MATYAAFKHVELYNVGKTKKRVLRPPGGGNSQLFGDDMPQTPRSVKNHMASNIFGSEQNASVKQNGDSIRRGQKQIDSYTRLFGEPERNYTPAKNHMKSSIPIGGTSTSSSSTSSNGTETNGHKNGNGVHHHQNGNGTITSSSASSSARNGKMENGGGSSSCTSSEYQNGVSKTVHNYRKMSNTSRTNLPSNRTTTTKANSKIVEKDENNRQQKTTTSLSPRQIKEEMGDNDSIMKSSRQPNGDILLQNGDDVDKLSNIKEDDDTLSIIDNNNNKNNRNMRKQEKDQVSLQLRSQKSNYTESTINSVRNMDIDSSNNSKTVSSATTTNPSSAATTPSYGLINFANANVKSPRRDFNTIRNPVTGTGFGDGLNIRIRRGANVRRDGNPVTGEGYKGAEINTSIPSLNGANQVINKNRIPPGGYSSGLW
ncbi:microtubule-associated protein Jupiter isoform X2 [Condylostylus longicornis]|uniref:microtubule-associated protein Jupiter isoform X2 n=1 Tax=Condylostylus longicornis TaxID=2530218 RepID=UPI00244E1D85|nr:microtubule-associated protein Jupiter isoform X2 [Condylostylus longicornis]